MFELIGLVTLFVGRRSIWTARISTRSIRPLTADRTANKQKAKTNEEKLDTTIGEDLNFRVDIDSEVLPDVDEL